MSQSPQSLQDTQYGGQGVQWKTWKHLSRFARAYPRKLRLVALFAFAVGLADISFPLVTKYLIDAIERWQAEGGATPSLWPYGFAYAACTLVLCCSVFSFIRVVGFLKVSVAADIRQAGFHNLQQLEFAYYDQRATGWLMSRMTSDCERLATIMAWGTLDVLWASSFLIGITTVLLVLHWKLGLLVLTVMPLLVWASRAFQKRQLKASRKIRKINSAITADFNESIQGVATTKAFARQAAQAQEFGGRVEELQQASVRNAVLSALYLPTVVTIGSLATALVLLQGGLFVSSSGMSLGTLVAFLAYTRLLFEPLRELAMIFGDLQMAQASAERIVELLTTEPQIVDSPEVQARLAQQAADPQPGRADDGWPQGLGAIEFEHVHFGYAPTSSSSGAGNKVLEDIHVRIEPGQTVALVGSTGGGKTTLISLLCRFYEPTSGRITVGGIDVQDRSLAWLHSNFGIVLQDPFLFGGTVMENIRYGRLDATDEEVREAARWVGVHDFVTRLEGGYDFEVGEGGTKLSQGERQLVSFARALLKNPAVLIMDEATANVDTETERHIQAALERVLEGRTSFVIAHRLSTIERADLILVIESGRIVERGSHAELIALGGRYAGLHQHQGLATVGRSEDDWSHGV